MGRLITKITLLSILLFTIGFPAISTATEKIPADTALLERTCTDCHDIEQILEKKCSMSEWQTIVNRMMSHEGSEISQIDKLRVLKYIKENLAVEGPGGQAQQKDNNK